jgi:hypothetical protein
LGEADALPGSKEQSLSEEIGLLAFVVAYEGPGESAGNLGAGVRDRLRCGLLRPGIEEPALAGFVAQGFEFLPLVLGEFPLGESALQGSETNPCVLGHGRRRGRVRVRMNLRVWRKFVLAMQWGFLRNDMGMKGVIILSTLVFATTLGLAQDGPDRGDIGFTRAEARAEARAERERAERPIREREPAAHKKSEWDYAGGAGASGGGRGVGNLLGRMRTIVMRAKVQNLDSLIEARTEALGRASSAKEIDSISGHIERMKTERANLLHEINKK